jgi:hypothetical protein
LPRMRDGCEFETARERGQSSVSRDRIAECTDQPADRVTVDCLNNRVHQEVEVIGRLTVTAVAISAVGSSIAQAVENAVVRLSTTVLFVDSRPERMPVIVAGMDVGVGRVSAANGFAVSAFSTPDSGTAGSDGGPSAMRSLPAASIPCWAPLATRGPSEMVALKGGKNPNGVTMSAGPDVGDNGVEVGEEIDRIPREVGEAVVFERADGDREIIAWSCGA